MRKVWLAALIGWAAALAAPASALTMSQVRLDEEISEEFLSELAGGPVALNHDADGNVYAFLPDSAVRELAQREFRFEVLQTFTTVSEIPEEKSLQSISGHDSVGFPINFANYGTITISGAPANAVVSRITVRLRGIAAYTDLCWFQLRDTSNIRYTFPKWYDYIWFDHTVSGITAFNGRPVNQPWRLWGQGSNTAGERVYEWWITIYYQSPSPPGEGEGEGEGWWEGEGEDGVFWRWGCPSGFSISPPVPTSNDAVSFSLSPILFPSSPGWENDWATNECFATLSAGNPTLSFDYTNRIVNLYFVPVRGEVCILLFSPVNCLRGRFGPLPPGNWRFVSYSRVANVNFPFVVTPYVGEGEGEGEVEEEIDPPPPGVRIIGRAWVESGDDVLLRAAFTSLTGEVACQWYKDDAPIDGATGPEYHIPFAAYEHAGVYHLVVEDESKAVYQSPPFVFTVYPENSLSVATPLGIGALTLIFGAAFALQRYRRIRP